MTCNIYKMKCSETDKVYFGSTVKTLQTRLTHHKSTKNTKSRELKNPTIELLEVCKIEDRNVRERFYIVNNECVNKHIPLRTKKEWNEDTNNKEKQKLYYSKNKDRITRTLICDCGSMVSFHTKSRHYKTEKHLKHLAFMKSIEPKINI
jgi:hypothetical protein